MNIITTKKGPLVGRRVKIMTVGGVGVTGTITGYGVVHIRVAASSTSQKGNTPPVIEHTRYLIVDNEPVEAYPLTDISDITVLE